MPWDGIAYVAVTVICVYIGTTLALWRHDRAKRLEESSTDG